MTWRVFFAGLSGGAFGTSIGQYFFFGDTLSAIYFVLVSIALFGFKESLR